MKEITIDEFKKMKKRPLKYRNRLGLYASKKEEKYARMLEMQKKVIDKNKKVLFWFPQVPIEFSSGIKMVIDFLVCYADGHWELHEVKSKATRTTLYKNKVKLLKSEYGLEVKEIL